MSFITITIASLVIFIVFYSIFNRFYYKKKILNKLKVNSIKHEGNKILESKKLIKAVSIGKTKGLRNKIEDKLSYGGLEIDGNLFINTVVIALMVLFSLILIVTKNFILTAASICLSLIAINKALNILIKIRIKKVSEQLLDMVITLSSSLKSGYSLVQGLSSIAQLDLKPLSKEIEFVLKDINIGQSYEEAFERMIKRNPIEDLEILITGILINKETGGNLSHILDNISETVRERERIQGEIRSLTAQGRLSGVILSLMPIGIGALVYMINPAYMKPFFQHPLGKILLMVAASGEILGVLVIKKITKIDW